MKHTKAALITVLVISISACGSIEKKSALINTGGSKEYETKAIETPSVTEYSPISESIKLLNGAKSILLQYNIYADDSCHVDTRQLHSLLDQQLASYGKLKSVEASASPDLLAILNVEIPAIPFGSSKPDACMYLVNLRVVHPMFGKMRYGKDPVLIQALTFNKSAHGLIVPDKINDAIQIQSMKLLNLLISDHRAGTLNQ